MPSIERMVRVCALPAIAAHTPLVANCSVFASVAAILYYNGHGWLPTRQ